MAEVRLLDGCSVHLCTVRAVQVLGYEIHIMEQDRDVQPRDQRVFERNLNLWVLPLHKAACSVIRYDRTVLHKRQDEKKSAYEPLLSSSPATCAGREAVLSIPQISHSFFFCGMLQ